MGTEGTSTHMMTSLNNSEELPCCSLFYRNFRVKLRDNKAILMKNKWKQYITLSGNLDTIVVLLWVNPAGKKCTSHNSFFTILEKGYG